ncbi:MAG TPA: hypothetical protein VF414_01715 [Thermoanaerobaculia bacterium]
MRSANSFASKTTSWEILAAGVEPHLPEMPHLQGLYDQLQGVMGKARGLDSQQESARAQVRELTRLRQEVEREGENLRARIAAHLRATFGFTSEQLIKFGINPRPRVTRRRAAEPDVKSQPAAE